MAAYDNHLKQIRLNGFLGLLERDGYVVFPGMVPAERVEPLAAAYDVAVASAPLEDVRVGRMTTRVNGVLSRVAELDGLLVNNTLLEAARRIIGGPFKLSSLHARTLRSGSSSEELHVDVQRESDAWPIASFILMVDAFRPDNGATRFVPSSQRSLSIPQEGAVENAAGADRSVLACGAAGSLLVFNGSTWHGHTANVSSEPRRSIQGAFVPRAAQAAIDWNTRLPSEMLNRMGPLARYVLALPGNDRDVVA